jgi:hypothetical protein
MREVSPQEFLKTLNHHLSIARKVSTSEVTHQEMAKRLEIVEESLSRVLAEYKANHQLISELVENYNKSKNTIEPETPGTEFQNSSVQESENLAKINNAKEVRTALDQEILKLRNEKNSIRSSINNFRPQGDAKQRWNSSELFFDLFKTKVALYSIVKLELSDGIHTFILLGKDLGARFFLSDFEYLKADTPIAQACFGRKPGDEIAYKAPSGLELKGRILECSLPSIQQMDQVISALNEPLANDASDKITPFHLHDLYGSNNSRLRKGG